MGDDEISDEFKEKLEQNLDDFHSYLIEMLRFYHASLRSYSQSMENALGNVESYFKPNDLLELQQKTKNSTLAKVCE